jgi:hypothetical protein
MVLREREYGNIALRIPKVAVALALMLVSCAACQRVIGPALLAAGGHPEAALAMQQQAIQREEARRRQDALKVVLATYSNVFDETGNAFEARRQAKAQHALFFAQNPEISKRVDQLTALLWVLEGGEEADAACYMRGFQFGTAHHNQCVYEVKMGRGGGTVTATPPPVPRSEGHLASRISPPPATGGGVEQGGKVYDPSECIGPVIMGRCHGQILPNKAYHPTCYGSWLNGHCTGPMF